MSESLSSIALINFLLDNEIAPALKAELGKRIYLFARGMATEQEVRSIAKGNAKAEIFLNILNITGVALGVLIGIAGLMMAYSSGIEDQRRHEELLVEQERQHEERMNIIEEQNKILREFRSEFQYERGENQQERSVPKLRFVPKHFQEVKNRHGQSQPNRKARRKAQAVARRRKI